MITDNRTNFLYLSEKLKQYDNFFESLTAILEKHRVPHAFLPLTKDIWAVDYMPVQVNPNKFVRFTYDPDYLKYKKYASKITDSEAVCKAINVFTLNSNISVDGGNVIRGEGWAILTDKIFQENPGWDKMKLITELEQLLETRVIIIPREPGDYTGHADGILRYYDEETVLINAYRPDDKKHFQRNLRIALRNAGLRWIEIPYNPYGNPSSNEADGLYINYLQMQNFVLVPTFGLDEDEVAIRRFEELFKGQRIESIESNQISKHGGVLNCITWNIWRNHAAAI